jgi:DNA-binding MarR family transcriptional regulator
MSDDVQKVLYRLVACEETREMTLRQLVIFLTMTQELSTLEEIAANARVTTASVCRGIDLLERHRLVSRRVDPADNRRRLLRLTEKGWGILRQVVGVSGTPSMA